MKYTFYCRVCGETQVIEHGMNEPHPTTCRCGGQLERRFDNPNVIFLGGGFYTNDKRLTPVKPEDYNPDED